MKNNHKNNPGTVRRTLTTSVILSLILLSGCEDFLDADIDKSLITQEVVFSNDITATSAMTGIYHDLINFSPFSGINNGIPAITGLSSDEFTNFEQTSGFVEFEDHAILPTNGSISGLWNFTYNIIYQSNAVLEGLSRSTGVTQATSIQLQGEALFVRSLCYFYLVNLFGDVPLVLTTDYTRNAQLPRTPLNTVYDQIITDLTTSQSFLTDDYITGERVRPNKATSTALLARVYLYRGDFENAEAQSTAIIDNGTYFLESDLNSVFLSNSNEAIFQLMPVEPNSNTPEGVFFFIESYPAYHVMNDVLFNAFEPNDNRKTSWVGTVDVFNFPYKYKAGYKNPEDPFTEYSVVFRLAEMYLIRAEARARLNKLTEAIEDTDAIRGRAGLPLIADTDPGISQTNLLLAIEHERQVELFTEWGHRWLDLKRTGRAVEVLGGDITANDLLYPIPQSEFDKNPKLGNQNSGY